ncbi:MAG: class I SAM-dependent methyltransferase [Bdellovibrionales bacterium]|nr:class I SAM-dependent methyltransferase [Bdellovibrionales bacterium]
MNQAPRAASLEAKLQTLTVCPHCHVSLDWSLEELVCASCGDDFPRVAGTPLLLSSSNVFRESIITGSSRTGKKSLASRLYAMRPDERLWSKGAIQTIHSSLEWAVRRPDPTIINIGAGFEQVFEEAFKPYEPVLRVGIPHRGGVDLYGDLTALPLANSSVDLLFCSSVLEHVSAPAKAMEEIARVLRPRGRAYIEIPFIRAYHMAPHDFQRYTPAGMRVLLQSAGLNVAAEGISSGPFTALALLVRDLCVALAPRGLGVSYALSWLLQPLKHVDRLLDQREWAAACACNLFCLAEKPTTGT